MDSSAHTVKIQTQNKKKEKDPQGNTKVLCSRINFEDPTALLQTRTQLANFISWNLNSNSYLNPNQ